MNDIYSGKSGELSRRDFVKYSAGAVACTYLTMLNIGCSSNSSQLSNYATSATIPLVVFSDLHFNPFYDPSLLQRLVAEDVSQWEGIFKTSNIKTPSAWGQDTSNPLLKDTNYPLLMLALSSIQQNLGASPLVIFTGDLLGHGVPQQFYQYYYVVVKKSSVPKVPDATAVAAMKAFTNKALAFVMAQVRSYVGNLPVMFALGNSDSYSGYGPNLDANLIQDNSFLTDNAELFYTVFLSGTANYQDFLSTFTVAGYYSAEPRGTNVMVVALNTILFTTLFYPHPDAGNIAAVTAELDWLDLKLTAAETAGKKVVLLMHAPPGVDITSTLNALGSASRPITTATMMWWPDYQKRFLDILSRHQGTVSLTLAGHTHMDDYRMLTPIDTLEIMPAIASYSGNNPAYKIFTVVSDTFRPIDYTSLNCDLATNPPQFTNYYTFSTAYALQGVLDASLAQLTPTLVYNNTKQGLYRGYYYSGHNTPVSVADTQTNPVNNVNWPFYWSAIGKMTQQEYIAGVNSY